MRKLLVSILMLLGTFSMVSADIGVKIGFSGELGEMTSSGKEQNTAVSTISATQASTDFLFAKGTYFIEKDLKFLPVPIISRISIGYDNMAHDINLGSTTNTTRNRDEATVAHSLPKSSGGGDDDNNSVSAEITGMDTIYATINITDWLYLKTGQMTMDIKTVDSLETGGIYKDNHSMDGHIFGIGVETQNDAGFFGRFEIAEYTIDGLTVNNTASDSNRKITINETSGTTYKVSIGKAF